MDVLFQPIVQTYNTDEDAAWYKQAETWPSDTEKAATSVERLVALKREGASIANSQADLESMIAYFRQPDAWRVATQAHAADQARFCAALTTLQFQANGDVTVCSAVPPVGNVKQTPIRQIWKQRPQFWVEGCCIPRRCAPAELEVMQEVNRGLVQVQSPR
jgi:MoaA/NifB/PqqE/SkfB family radical SAM enzyme